MSHTTLLLFILLCITSCQAQPAAGERLAQEPLPIICGAERTEAYLPALKGKKVALLINQTATVGSAHLVDTLVQSGVQVVRIFAPEHGFRGVADAGEHIRDGKDAKTGVPITSLYGSRKKPSREDLQDADLVIFDIQDVGARFYTFISSLHYLMEACVEYNKPLMVLDRPNPNGWYVDGPVLEPAFTSFVGVDPIPVVHGLTVGEYAQMVNGEQWLPQGRQCALQVIPCANYTHAMRYTLPVKPSPNLPNAQSIYLYPSICFFEGTDISVARGTTFPFQAVGAPSVTLKTFSFTPQSVEGAKSPPHLNKVCYGLDLRKADSTRPGLDLSYLISMYKHYPDTAKFFLSNGFFDKLAGTASLRKQIIQGVPEADIKKSWQPALNTYKAKRKKYLLYPDYE